MSTLELERAHLSIGGAPVLSDVRFVVRPGEIVGLLGPNGAGKTSAVRALLGLIPLTRGAARIGGRDPASMTAPMRARAVAYLPQTRPMAWPVAVREVVALGRFAHGGPLGRLGAEDRAAVDRALDQCGLAALADRSVAGLSGGELARVHLARALAAEAPALIADEPTAGLDPRHAFSVLALLQARARAGAAVLTILHDLSLAARFCDRVVLLDQGGVAAQGLPRDALAPVVLAAVYGVRGRWSGDGLSVIGVI